MYSEAALARLEGDFNLGVSRKANQKGPKPRVPLTLV